MLRRHSVPLVRRALFVAVSIVLAAAPLRAQDVALGAAGGTGGDPYSITCGSKALVGIGGQEGSTVIGQPIIYNLYLLCVTPNADGYWFKGNVSAVGKPIVVGKPGPSDSPTVELMCPSYNAVSGIKGRAASYVSDVEVLCSQLASSGSGLLTGSAKTLSSLGVSGSSQIAGWGLFTDPGFGPSLCPQNLPGKALSGRAHDWVDRVALTCGVPTLNLPKVEVFNVNSSGTPAGTLSGTMQLDAPAISGGMQVTLSQQGGPALAFAPNPVTIPAGQKNGTFTVKAPGVTSTADVGIYTTLNGKTSLAGYAYLGPPALARLSLSASTVGQGAAVTGTLVLSTKAFAGGLAVQLTTGDATVATTPATVIIPQGDTSATFPVTLGQSANACTFVRADYNAVQKSAYVAILPPAGSISQRSKAMMSLGGSTGSSQLTVRYLLPVASARTVTLTSSSPSIVAVPSTVSVPANASSVNVGLTISNPGGALACASITARDGSTSDTLILSLQGASVVGVTP